MSSWKRWLLAVVGAFAILVLIFLLFQVGDWSVRNYYIDDCLDRGGAWDYSRDACQF
ncbi:hypothetical protein [Ponticaulis profundi]|uniref:Uncharacterized protein n=1 Tax=Ponticaulis profundi TaxID=2665222 RepID=A0ABW1S6R1_9PROT